MGKQLDVAARDHALYTDLPAPPTSGGERSPTRDEMTELLAWVASAPHPVAGRLRALANVVRVLRRCPWIDGALRMELQLADDTTTVHLFSGLGGAQERALPEMVLDVAIDDLRTAMQRTPDLFAPLVMSVVEDDDRLVFVAHS
jgi:hypothetical protein